MACLVGYVGTWAILAVLLPARALRLCDARDILALLGLGLVVAGVAQIYMPAAYIIPGLGLIGLALWRIRS